MSPIPLGIWATAGAGSAAAGSYELISTAYGNGSSDTITISDIPQTYKHLQLRCVVKTTANTSVINTTLRINGQTGSAYRGHYIVGNGSSVSANDSNGGTGTKIFLYNAITGNTTGYADIYSGNIIDILDYTNSSKNPVVKLFGGMVQTSSGANRVYLESGMLDGPMAITSLTFQGVNSTDYFTSASRISLYGIKG